ncbi:MAG: hypothetical protein U0P45_00315 [Acidimicrobiales bacterium]
MLLALLATWSVVVGDLRVAPILVASATVAAQVHVAGAAFVAPLLLVAAIAIVAAWRRHPATVRRDRPWLLGALGLLLLLWLPPLAQELSAGPSNVAALWTTATAPRPRIGLAFTAERLATAIAPIPTFLRDTGRFGFLRDEPPIGVVAAALIVGGAASLALLLRDRRRRSPAARLTGLVLLAMATSTVSAAGQPPLAAFRADGTRWLWVVSLGIWLAAAWSAWQLVGEERRDRLERPTLLVGAGLAAVLLLLALGTARLGGERDGAVMGPTAKVSSELLRDLPKGRYHVRFEGNQALVTLGPGIVYRLEAAGYHVTLDDNTLTRGYGTQRTDGRSVDGELHIASGPSRPAEGERLVAEAPIDPDDPSAGTIKVYASR